MELVFGDKLQVIRQEYRSSRFGGPRDILIDAIFVKVCVSDAHFYYHIPNANPKELQVLPLISIVTVNTKPYK